MSDSVQETPTPASVVVIKENKKTRQANLSSPSRSTYVNSDSLRHEKNNSVTQTTNDPTSTKPNSSFLHKINNSGP